MNNLITPADIAARCSALEALALDPAPAQAVEIICTALKEGHKILVFGNGGSATQAAHFSAELVNRFLFDRSALPAISLVTDMAALTSIANDDDFDAVFSRQLEALGRAGDVALGLSTSGTSRNVLLSLGKARELGLRTIALCGRNRQALDAAGCTAVIAVDSIETPLIQEMHLFLLHLLAGAIEKNIFGGKNARTG